MQHQKGFQKILLQNLKKCGKQEKELTDGELFLFSREDRIRTCDPLVPNQVRYRPALLPVLNDEQELSTSVPVHYFLAVREGFEPSVQL